MRKPFMIGFNNQKSYAKLALILFIAICTGCISCSRQTPKEPKEVEIPHIILISIDTCRADYLSCYGYPEKTTPNIDQLAEKNYLFEHAVSPVPITLPAHSSMLTGTIPPYHGVRSNVSYKLGSSHLTIAEILKGKGYSTAAFVGSFMLDSQFGTDQGFDTYNDQFEKELKTTDLAYLERRGEEVSRLATKWIDQNYKNNFFLFLHYFDPHGMYIPPEPYATEFSENLYAGEIAYTDYCISQVFDQLKSLGIYDSSLIIITSDHGEGLMDHGERMHSFFVYHSTVHIPLIIKPPYAAKPKRIKNIVSSIDIVPTILSMAGMEIPDHVQGESLIPYMKNKSSSHDRYIYTETFEPTRYDGNPIHGIVSDKWKYIHTTRPELYDLANDWNETNNLIEKEPKQARSLLNSLKEILENYSSVDTQNSELMLDSENIKKLEALGYVSGSVALDSQLSQSGEDPKDLIHVHNQVLQIQIYNAHKQNHKAKELLKQLIVERPDIVRLHGLLGEIALEDGDTVEAISAFQKALELNAQNVDAHYYLASILYEQDQAAEALAHAKEALSIKPKIVASFNTLAAELFMKGKRELIVPLLEMITEQNPQLVDASNNLALILIEQGKTEEPLEYLFKAVSANPDFANTHNNLSLLLLKLGRLEEALTHYEKAVAIDPAFENPGAYYTLARQLARKKNFAKAVQYYRRALAIKPDFIEAENNLAWILATGDETIRHADEAIELAERICEAMKYKNVLALDTLAAAYAEAGRFREAVLTAEKAIAIAQANNQSQLAESIQSRLKLYRQSIPFHQDNQ